MPVDRRQGVRGGQGSQLARRGTDVHRGQPRPDGSRALRLGISCRRCRAIGATCLGGGAWVEGLGWIGFDPSTGFSPDESYVRVAIGLDASSAAATGGMRIGQGQEQLDVDLHVDQLGVEE
jgi:hypothetical protein